MRNGPVMASHAVLQERGAESLRIHGVEQLSPVVCSVWLRTKMLYLGVREGKWRLERENYTYGASLFLKE